MIEFDRCIRNREYIEAVKITLNLSKLVPEEPYRKRLFGEHQTFVKALRQTVDRGDAEWLNQLSQNLPPWYFEHPGDGTDSQWCQERRRRFLNAQIRCAQQAILISSMEDIGLEEWKRLAEETKFPVGFVYDMMTMLINDDLKPRLASRTKIPVLLEDPDGRSGIAAYLFLEQVPFEPILEQIPSNLLNAPYPHPTKMSRIPLDEKFEEAVSQAFTYVCRHGLPNDHRGIMEILGRLISRKNRHCLSVPTIRWWIERATNDERRILALTGPSMYGAFVIGIVSCMKEGFVNPEFAISFDGDEYGRLRGVGGLAAKSQAAARHGWSIIICNNQDQDDNIVAPLLSAESIEKALKTAEIDVENQVKKIKKTFKGMLDKNIFETMKVKELPITDEIRKLITENSEEHLMELAKATFDLYLLAPTFLFIPPISRISYLYYPLYYLIARYLYQAIRNNNFEACRHKQFIHQIHQYLSKMIRETQPEEEKEHLISNLITWLNSTKDVPKTSRDFAAFELGMCKVYKAVGDLLKALEDNADEQKFYVRLYAAMALGMLRDKGTLVTLLKIFDDELVADIKRTIAHAIIFIWENQKMREYDYQAP